MQQSKIKDVGSRLSDFKIIKELGKGSYATVYTVKSIINSNIYVMKKMELNHLTPRQQQECYREVSILKKVSHKNIIKYYSSFLEKEILYIIMEYAELGDLYTLIKHYKKHSKYFDELDLWKISSEILSGLDYLHSHNIIHRDIKCLNIFITKDRHIKIGDLGVSAFSSGVNNLHYTRVGTPLYISPELVKQKPYDYKTDIWSFGCSLYHMACLEPPFTGGNLIVLGNNIVKGIPKPLPQQYSDELRNFVDKMLEKKADKRPSASEALDMIPLQIKSDIKVKGEKVQIKSKRPFSSAVTGNKVITVNKEEIRNLFGEINNNKNEKNKKEKNNNDLKNEINNALNNKDTEKINNNNFINKDDMLKNNYVKSNRQLNLRVKSEEKNKLIGDNKKKEENNYNYFNKLIFESYNDLKAKNEVFDDISPKQKRVYDLSFNIPSFNNQKGFKNFRQKQKIKKKFIIDDKYQGFTLDSKFHVDYNNIKLFSPLFQEITMTKSKKDLKQYFQHNLIKSNKNPENKKENINDNNSENNKEELIKKENIQEKEESNINIANNNIKNINIINIIEEGNNNIKNNKKENKSFLLRLNTDNNNQTRANNIFKFPELNNRNIILQNHLKKSSFNNNAKNELNNNKDNFLKNKNKRLASASPNQRIFTIRPLTSKINKNIITFNNKIKFNKDTFNNIIKETNYKLDSIKDNLNSETKRNYTENKDKKINYRPMTGFHPQINNNVMNININFYNIDMNKRFLIPDINPYNQDEHINQNNKENNVKDKNKNDIGLDKYKNSNEFLFQKIIKSIQEINGYNKRLTIKDLN